MDTETASAESETGEVSIEAEQPAEMAPAARPPFLPIPIRDQMLAYSHAITFEQFIDEPSQYAELCRLRYTETRLTASCQALMARYSETLHILALVTEEDPDTLAVVPVIARVVNACSRLDLRILTEEGDLTPLQILAPELDVRRILDEWDLPQFLIFDEEWELQAQWGPRPGAAEEPLEAWLARHPEFEASADDESPSGQARYAALTSTLIYEMRVWYNSGLDVACQEEFCELLETLQADDDGAEQE